MKRPRQDLDIHVFESVSSTNDTIHEAALEGAREGTTHLARRQTGGRGRAGRSWWSPPDAGLWMSTLLTPDLPRDRWSGLALLAGVASKVALAELGVRRVEVEWPNDLVSDRRKLGGILCEVREGEGRAWIALGIGINIDLTGETLRSGIPEPLRESITCLTEAGPPATRSPREIAGEILDAFWPLYRRFTSGESLRTLVEPHMALGGRPVRVSLPDGRDLRGSILRLGESGELIVRASDGSEIPVVAGDVMYLSP